MGSIERPELLPDCDTPARGRTPDDLVLTSLARLTDESLSDSWRISNLLACATRGGATLAAATFVFKAPGPWHENLQRILRLSGVNVDRPTFSYSDYTVGLCYVAGAKGVQQDCVTVRSTPWYSARMSPVMRRPEI